MMWSHGKRQAMVFGRRLVMKELTMSSWSPRSWRPLQKLSRFLSSSSSSSPLEEPRETMPFDVLIVGGGPAGLAASIRLKQLCQQHGKELSVCLIDKGSEIGAHILSGNVFDPTAMHELFPEMSNPNDAESYWTRQFHNEQGSYATPVQQDKLLVLPNATSSFALPHFLLPPQMHNHGNFVISLSQLCRWLAKRAEELGVEIYPGFSASEVVFWDSPDNNGNREQSIVKGVATRDVGIGKHGEIKPTFARGVELHARQTIFAEGARGSCSEFLMDHFQLRNDNGVQPQTYGLGLKEVWQVPPDVFQPGLVQHTLGFPLQSGVTDKVFGGSFLYHQEPDLVLIGLVVGLDYANPYLNPYQEFQRWKTHPEIRKHLQGGTCISYGARVLNEGGYHAIPKCTFPGGALIGCSAGFLNAVKIKGSHTAMKSGMLAAESIFTNLTAANNASEMAVAETGELPEPSSPQAAEVTQYSQALSKSWVYDELHKVRNCHAAFSKWGVGGGVVYTGLATHITKGHEPWTLTHSKTDAEQTKPAQQFQPIAYPAPDGKLTFDLLTNLQRSGTYHEEDQPAHLRIKPELASIPENTSLQVYGAPESRFCPAGVYEYVEQAADDSNDSNNKNKKSGDKKLVINAQNCIHCKCCSIKCPKEYIQWTVPEGGGGPQYQVM